MVQTVTSTKSLSSAFSQAQPLTHPHEELGEVVTSFSEEDKIESASANGGKKRSRDDLDEENVDDDNTSEDLGEGDELGWEEHLHKKFVMSLFEIGLRNASPAVMLENRT